MSEVRHTNVETQNCTTNFAIKYSAKYAALKKFLETKVTGLKTTAPGKWHRHVKTMTGSKSTSTLNMDHLSKDPEELTGVINNYFASVCNQMPCLNLSCLPAFRPTLPPPLVSPGEVRRSLNKINTSKATHQSDIPSKIIKEFSFDLTEPITDASLQEGVFPAIWKTSTITPIPKVQSAKTLDKLRPISLTKFFGSIFEKFLADWTLEDFSPHIDIKQYGNIPDSSTMHYLVDLVNEVLRGVDRPGHYASLCAIDFAKAFDLINHNVAVKKLIDIGVRSEIVPVICSFVTNRTQTVKYLGNCSPPLQVWGGVAQGTNFGSIIFSAVANDSAINAPLR